MYLNGSAGKTSHIARARRISDATRQARILRCAADVIDADPDGRPINARDVRRLLARSIPPRDAQAIADVIRDLWAPGRMGRDAEVDYLRCMAHAVIVDSRPGYRGAR
jgi:hypothetical protein